MVQAKLAKAGSKDPPTAPAPPTTAVPMDDMAATAPAMEASADKDNDRTDNDDNPDDDAPVSSEAESTSTEVVLEPAVAASVDADQSLRAKASALMANPPQLPPAGPGTVGPAPPEVAPPPPPPPPAETIPPTQAPGGGWLGRIVKGLFGQGSQAKQAETPGQAQARGEQPRPVSAAAPAPPVPSGGAPQRAPPPVRPPPTMALAAPPAVEESAALRPMPEQQTQSGVEGAPSGGEESVTPTSTLAVSPPVPGPLPPGLFFQPPTNGNGNGNGGSIDASAATTVPDGSKVDRSQLVGNDGGEGFEGPSAAHNPSRGAAAASPPEDLTATMLGVMQDLADPMFTARPPSPGPAPAAVRVLPNGRPPSVEEAPVGEVVRAVQRAAQRNRERNQPIVLTVARALGAWWCVGGCQSLVYLLLVSNVNYGAAL